MQRDESRRISVTTLEDRKNLTMEFGVRNQSGISFIRCVVEQILGWTERAAEHHCRSKPCCLRQIAVFRAAGTAAR
jgi:hypothetical protein